MRNWILFSWWLRLSLYQYIISYTNSHFLSRHSQQLRYTKTPHWCVCSTFPGCSYVSPSSTLLPVFSSSILSVHMSVVGDNHVTYSTFWASCHIQSVTSLQAGQPHAPPPPKKGAPTTKTLPFIRVKWILNNIALFTTSTRLPVHKITIIIESSTLYIPNILY